MQTATRNSRRRKEAEPCGGGDNGQFLTLAQLAEMLNLCTETVKRLVRDGVLPHYRLSRKIMLFRRHEVEEALMEVRVPSRNGS